FNEKHALETLPKTIEKLQAEIAKQQKLLDDPTLYARDRKTFDEASRAIARAQEELATAEDRWLELEVLREEIEQAWTGWFRHCERSEAIHAVARADMD